MKTHPIPVPSSGTASMNSSKAGSLPVFIIGLVSYAIGMAALVAWIASTFAILGFSGGPLHIENQTSAIAFNLGLIVLFGLQHTIMAGRSFKNLWSRILPQALERSGFVLVTGLLLGAMLWLWQPLSHIVWEVGSPIGKTILYAMAGIGWTYLLLASFAIDHFELFGLRQVWRRLRGHSADTLSFQRRGMYAFDRHPIMSGALVGMWSVPVMSLDRLLMAAGLSLYILVGVSIEERRLYEKHGRRYKEYRASVRSLVPRILRWS